MNKFNVCITWHPWEWPKFHLFRYPRDTKKLRSLIAIFEKVLERQEKYNNGSS